MPNGRRREKMGQRSQIYVRYEVEGAKKLIARYFQWNYGERMISRARYTMDWLEVNREYLNFEVKKVIHILETNFDMIDCVGSADIMQDYNDCLAYAGINEEYTFRDFILSQDNNNGVLFIDVLPDKIKYGFLNWECNTDNVMTARQYMDNDLEGWDNSDHKILDKKEHATCIRNIKEIDCRKHHELMTSEEVEEFISYDYSAQLAEYKEKKNDKAKN